MFGEGTAIGKTSGTAFASQRVRFALRDECVGKHPAGRRNRETGEQRDEPAS